MDIFISSKTKDLAFEKSLNCNEINYANRNYMELNESEVRKLVYILDDLVQERELAKLLNR